MSRLMSGAWRVLVAERIGQQGLAHLRQTAEVTHLTNTSQQELLAALATLRPHALIVRSAVRVGDALLAAGTEQCDPADGRPALRLVARAGVGVDNIDVSSATRLGVQVINMPFGNTITTAEHTIALLLAVARALPQANAAVRRGVWSRAEFLGVELAGKTLGVVGLGRIGGAVAARARALGMQPIAYDPYIPAHQAAALGVPLVPDLRVI